MSVKLELLTFNCVTNMSQIQKVRCQDDDEDKNKTVKKNTETELEGEEILNENNAPDTKHLSPEMLKIAKKYPKTFKDNLKGCEAFKDQAHKKLI